MNLDERLTALSHTAFPGQSPGTDEVVLAIAAYTRTLTGGNTAFDTWLAGDVDAMSDQQKRGFLLFNGQAKFAACHSGWTFTDNDVHDVGLSHLHSDDFVMSKTPTLQDVAKRAPYLHDGRAKTLEDVILHYNEGRRPRAAVHSVIQPLNLTPSDQKDLIAFLNTLTETAPDPTMLNINQTG